MITALCDGNYFFHKTFGIFGGFGSKNPGDVLSTAGDRNLFMRKIMTDLCYSLNQIPDLNKVIFCIDSKSWRKDYLITRSVYKESREKGEGVDWGSFFQLMHEFGEYLETLGFTFSKLGGAEGDDLLWAWSNHLKDNDNCTIILSGDRDMNQLVSYSEGKWVNVWTCNSKNNRLVVDKDWEVDKDLEPSVFDVNPTSGSSDSKIARLIASCTIDRIDIKEYVFKKILIGDKGDDVPGVFPFKKNDKNHNVTESKAQKVWDYYLQSTWSKLSLEEIWQDDEFLEWAAGLTLRLVSQPDNKQNRELFKQYYEENARLVWLNKNAIPEDMILGIEKHILELEAKERVPLVIDKKTMIERSPWTGDTTPKEFDPFNLFE